MIQREVLNVRHVDFEEIMENVQWEMDDMILKTQHTFAWVMGL
jgi:hypothetical protein